MQKLGNCSPLANMPLCAYMQFFLLNPILITETILVFVNYCVVPSRTIDPWFIHVSLWPRSSQIISLDTKKYKKQIVYTQQIRILEYGNMREGDSNYRTIPSPRPSPSSRLGYQLLWMLARWAPACSLKRGNQIFFKKNNLYTLNQKEYWKLKYLPYIAIQTIGVVQV